MLCHLDIFTIGTLLIVLQIIVQETFSHPQSSGYPTSTHSTQPYFDFDVQRNVTVTVGQTGFLHCRVERLTDKDVSWIRKRDLHILTAGVLTYTSDQRFQVRKSHNSKNWTLQIKYPTARDTGVYECQINTEPKMSLSYNFQVVELQAQMQGPSDLYVKTGSDIMLVCRVPLGPHEFANIFWYKGDKIIEMGIQPNEITSDKSDKIVMRTDWSNGLTSRLKIKHATTDDTGNYTCVPTFARSASVFVHIIIEEHPAAMQHNWASKLILCKALIALNILCALIRTGQRVTEMPWS